jgi:thiol-disulfide isomerase/thioredoxin
LKKILLILLLLGLIICLLVGCNAVTPPVSGGEGEGEGETVDRVVLVEFFTVGCPNCTVAEPIIEGLAEEYERTEMILVEERPWGMPVTPGANDRYEWYLPDSYDRNTPNTFYNGSNQRVWHGSAYYVFKSPIVNELAKDSKISISVIRSESNGTTTLTGKIKNISDSTLDNLVINGMTFKDYGKLGQKYLVLDIFKGVEEVGESLEAGAEQDFTFILEGIQWETSQLHGVIFVQSSSTKEVFQASYIE